MMPTLKLTQMVRPYGVELRHLDPFSATRPLSCMYVIESGVHHTQPALYYVLYFTAQPFWYLTCYKP